ncbi:Electron transfer flavoprotein regulatory factor 1 [Lamellibrachia satsuma]|nr:Electron transfer flavoprotein regulatory factor 1 [Lamellibrachia satsuma]
MYQNLKRNGDDTSDTMSTKRSQVIRLYKNLMHLGKDYPRGHDYFRQRLRENFRRNRDVTDEKEIELLILKGEFVSKELEALYMLRKYRALKSRYYEK